ncbi:MAG: PDZ domain-containing protein [Pleurocapsa sp. SU_196_0]|nr:PDZ domain-containing protein [Pleurocapsa sp. SU_196_0]
MSRALLAFVAFISLQAISLAQAPSPAQNLVTRAVMLLENNYFGFKPIDFTQLERDAETRVAAACTTQTSCSLETGAAVLDELLGTLGDGHTFRMNANRLRQFNADSRNDALPMLGLKFDALSDAPALVITRVREDSPAAQAGLKRGDVVWDVGERRLDSFKSATAATDFITALELSNQPVKLLVSSFTDGTPVNASGTTFTPSSVQERPVTLTPQALTSWLPTYTLRDDGIAVITFYQYLTNGRIASRVHEFVRQAQSSNAKAIILDVRGSGGGSSFESLASAGAFAEPVGVRFENRFGSGVNVYENGVINSNFSIPNPAKWNKPVVVLTNRLSRSAAEYMTYFLQRAGRAKVLGEVTTGVLNTSTSILSLPDGGAIAVTSGRSSTLNGVPHPEAVTPDVAIKDDMSILARGRDVVLERAVQFLNQP